MKICVIISLTIFAIGGCTQNSKDKANIPSLTEDWRTEQVEYQGTTTFIRYNHALTSLPKNHYPQLVRISLKYNTENPNGFPSDSEAKGLWKVEDLLEESLSKNNHALFAGTITMPNKRHFIFYCPSSDISETSVKSLVKTITSYEVGYSVQPDAEWNFFKGFYER